MVYKYKYEPETFKRYKEERDYFNFLSGILATMPDSMSQLSKEITDITVERYDTIMKCAEEGKPFVAGYFCAAPEIYEAMGMPWYMIMQTPFLAASAPYLTGDIDSAEAMGLGTDWCTACRLALYYVEAGLTPKPWALVGLIHPCDAGNLLHQAVKRNQKWRDVPIFASDPPYFEDLRGIDYYASELRRMVGLPGREHRSEAGPGPAERGLQGDQQAVRDPVGVHAAAEGEALPARVGHRRSAGLRRHPGLPDGQAEGNPVARETVQGRRGARQGRDRPGREGEDPVLLVRPAALWLGL